MIFTRFRFLVRNLLRRRRSDRDLTAEIAAYAEEMNGRERHSVRVEQVREEVRSARIGAGIEDWARDLRYAVRMLRKASGLTLACALTFAIGIGANTVVFSMANALVLRPLSVPKPAEIYYLQITQHDGAAHDVSRADLEAIRDQSGALSSGLATASMEQAGLRVAGQSKPMWASRVSGNFFSLMGVRPALGTFFADDRAPALVLSYDYWQSRFAGDRGIVGQTAVVDGKPVTIVGVAPRGFHGFDTLLDLQGYFPRGLEVAMASDSLAGLPLMRLRDGVSQAAAEAELGVIARRLQAAHPAEDRGVQIRAMPIGVGAATISRDAESGPNPLHVVVAAFLTMAGLVLLLAAANVMGLLLARASARQREMGVRSALGGSRLRLARQVFLETLLLAGVGAAAGMAVGVLASHAVSGIPVNTGLPVILDFSFDWRVFTYGVAMAVLVALVAGLAPAWRAAGADPNKTLRRDRRTGQPRQRLRSSLVVAQVAGSLALLVVGGLFVRSLRHAQTSGLGFEPNRVVNFPLNASGAGYDAARGQQYFDQVLARVRTLPGVTSASLAQTVPFGLEKFGGTVEIDAHPPAAGLPKPQADYNAISPGYFQTLRVPLLRGRAIGPDDVPGATAVAVINEAMARRYWPSQNPLGHRFALTGDRSHPMQVVGVVGDMREAFNGEPVTPYFFMPLAQHYDAAQILQVRGTAGDAAIAVEKTLRQLDPNVPLGDIQTMDEAVDGLTGLFLFRLGADLALGLGLLGLFLAVVGVYGVVAYSAAQRTHEIGIRVALGARPGQVAGAILRRALAMIGCGMALGLLLAVAIGKLVGTILVGVSALDPATYLLAVTVLGATALAASLIPAWRAMHGDPLAALRCE